METMKRLLVLAIILVGALALVAPAQRVAEAAKEAPMTEAHIERIRNNCVEAQSVLRRLHASDALLRVNRGQLYELISSKLMTPLNSRIAQNRLDPASLVSLTADYADQLDVFREDYIDYEKSMTSLLEMNCMDQPVAFYDKVHETRAKRQKVHQNTVTLHKTIGNYRDEFEVFAKTIEKGDEQ